MSSFQVKHALPNRIRFSIPALRNERLAHQFGKAVAGVRGVCWVRTNCRCAGAIVRFDADIVTESDILSHVGRCLQNGRGL